MIFDAIRDLFRPVAPVDPPTGLIDRRATSPASNRHGRRAWSSVRGITLHQTACVLGERPARWDSVGAHVGITRAGTIVWLHDFDRIVWHGNGWNAQTVGIEIDGRFRGVSDRPETGWQGAHDEPTEEQLDAARRAVRWICGEVARNGGQVTKLVAHRQSSATRRSDPGEAIWKGVALPVSAELGLDDGGDGFKIGDGMPVPREWDEKRTTKY
jgi:N-acetyl-anhydromuramyl-L-alanine amidase AmpD